MPSAAKFPRSRPGWSSSSSLPPHPSPSSALPPHPSPLSALPPRPSPISALPPPSSALPPRPSPLSALPPRPSPISALPPPPSALPPRPSRLSALPPRPSPVSALPPRPSPLSAPPAKASSAAKLTCPQLSFSVLPSSFALVDSVSPPKPKSSSAAPAEAPGPVTNLSAWSRAFLVPAKPLSAPPPPLPAPAKPRSAPAKPLSAPLKAPKLSSAPPARGLQIIPLPDSMLPDFITPRHARQARKRSSSALLARPAKLIKLSSSSAKIPQLNPNPAPLVPQVEAESAPLFPGPKPDWVLQMEAYLQERQLDWKDWKRSRAEEELGVHRHDIQVTRRRPHPGDAQVL